MGNILAALQVHVRRMYTMSIGNGIHQKQTM